MALFHSYGYPRKAPRVWITFGRSNGAPPHVAWLSRFDRANPGRPYELEVKGPWADHAAAYRALDVAAQRLLEQRAG
ncbi:hypothetical protein [Pseudomonas sp. NPDC007930]|uniref:hypothetical protein n=1 Tax=Pseudomonas sp. NPDC007930 TaxID=3364417 RepID=UPI0036E4446A